MSQMCSTNGLWATPDCAAGTSEVELKVSVKNNEKRPQQLRFSRCVVLSLSSSCTCRIPGEICCPIRTQLMHSVEDCAVGILEHTQTDTVVVHINEALQYASEG